MSEINWSSGVFTDKNGNWVESWTDKNVNPNEVQIKNYSFTSAVGALFERAFPDPPNAKRLPSPGETIIGGKLPDPNPARTIFYHQFKKGLFFKDELALAIAEADQNVGKAWWAESELMEKHESITEENQEEFRQTFANIKQAHKELALAFLNWFNTRFPRVDRPQKEEFTREKDKPSKPQDHSIEPNEAMVELPNTNADEDFTHAIMTYPLRWQLQDQLGNMFQDGRNGFTTTYQPAEVKNFLGDAPEKALNILDSRFKEIKSGTVADVVDILFHHWKTFKDTDTNGAFITAAMLCKYRGKVAEGENLFIHWHALRDAFSFGLSDTKSDLKAHLFIHESVGETIDGPGAKYVYSPGFMLQYALKGQALYWAPFLQKIWALDPVRHNEAKRLARYLRRDWRMNTEKYLTADNGAARAARWRTWKSILPDVGIEIEPHRKSKDPKRLITAVMKGVNTLYDMEAIAEGGLDIYHPQDRKIAENLPPRGALDAWLSLRVCLAPAAAPREALIETDGRRRANKARQANALATEKAKQKIRSEKRGQKAN